jgi:hypothetical protein
MAKYVTVQPQRCTTNHPNTQPDLTIILLQGVRGALHDPSYQMNIATREPRFQYLVNAQNKIGWQHLLKGRFSHHWLQCQQLHIYLDPSIDSTKNTGERWLKRILHCLWNSLWQVWLLRNDDLHGRDRQQREQKRIQKLTPRVTALYEKAEMLLAKDKDLFAIPLETRLTFPSGEICTWIKLVTPTVKQAIADADKFLRLTNHRILPFLIPQPDPLTLNEQVNELARSQTTSHLTKNSFHLVSKQLGCDAYLACQRCDRCQYGSTSGVGPPRGGGGEAVK